MLRLLVAPLVVALSSLVVLAGPATANGAAPAAMVDITDFVPKTAAGAAKNVPKGTWIVRAGAGGPLAASAFLLGYWAYSTRDTWMPIAKDWLGQGSQSSTGGGADCDATWAATRSTTDKGQVIATGTQAGNHPEWCGGFTNVYWRGSCNYPGNISGAVSGTLNLQFRVATPLNVCPSGATVTEVQLTIGNWNPGYIVQKFLFPFDPATGTVKTEVQCRKPDGSLTTITGRMDGATDRVPIPSCEAANPGGGWLPEGIKILSGLGNSLATIGDVITRPDYMTDYPNCFGPSGLLCQIFVKINGAECEIGMVICADWQGYEAAHPERVDCMFGPYKVGMASCETLKHSYVKPKTIIETDPAGNPDLDPNPPPVTDPTWTDVWKDLCLKACVVDPNPPPVDPEVVDPDTTGCLGEAVSFNPVDWVYVPVKCAFVWAFVPKTALSVRVNRIQGDLKNRLPFAWVTPILSMPSAVGGGCPDWRVKVGPLDKNVVCDSSYTSAIRGARPWLAAGMLAVAFWPLVRGLMFASVPLLKPVPTNDK